MFGCIATRYAVLLLLLPAMSAKNASFRRRVGRGVISQEDMTDSRKSIACHFVFTILTYQCYQENEWYYPRVNCPYPVYVCQYVGCVQAEVGGDGLSQGLAGAVLSPVSAEGETNRGYME